MADKDAARNALVVVQGTIIRAVRRGHRHGAGHWLAEPPGIEFTCQVKLRYRQADQPARDSPRGDGGLEVRFERPQRAVTPGQYCVLYAGERCLGGAVIGLARAADDRRSAARSSLSGARLRYNCRIDAGVARSFSLPEDS